MNRIRLAATLIVLVLAVAACAEVTVTMDNRTASGSGMGSTQQEALDAALAAACAQLGLSGNALSRCEAGQNPGAASWSTDYDCETT